MTDGYVVRMPQPAQLSKAMRRLGNAAFDEHADLDELVKAAIDAGKINVAWSYVEFDADPLPVPTRVPSLVAYGLSYTDPDRVLTHRDRYDNPTWRACRTGRRPTVFPDRATAEATVAEHLATAEHFSIVTGNLSFAQVVDVEVFEASLSKDPTDSRRATGSAGGAGPLPAQGGGGRRRDRRDRSEVERVQAREHRRLARRRRAAGPAACPL